MLYLRINECDGGSNTPGLSRTRELDSKLILWYGLSKNFGLTMEVCNNLTAS